MKKITPKQLKYLEQIQKLHGDSIVPVKAKLSLDKSFSELTKAQAHQLIDTLKAAGFGLNIDTESINAAADLLALIGNSTTLKKIAKTNGGEYEGFCPKCGGNDRFHAQPNASPPAWFCSHCTERKWSDAIGYGMTILDLDFFDACHYAVGGTPPVLANDAAQQPRQPVRAKASRLKPPPAIWQDRARAFVKYAESQLWQTSAALDYLYGRGLTDDTIKAARLGWNPKTINDKPSHWGVTDTARVWLPKGLVMPWFIGGEVWRVEIRTPEGRKIGPAGYKQGLYNADSLGSDKSAVLVEAVIDVLTIAQGAADLVTPAATGSTTHARQSRWVARLAQCPLVLVAFDNEPDKGEKAAQYWTRVLPNAKRWRPFWEDVNQMAQDGADIRRWVEAGLSAAQTAAVVREVSPPAAVPNQAAAPGAPYRVVTWPEGTPLTAVGDCYTLDRETGEVTATYQTKQEFMDSVGAIALIKDALTLGGEIAQERIHYGQQ